MVKPSKWLPETLSRPHDVLTLWSVMLYPNQRNLKAWIVYLQEFTRDLTHKKNNRIIRTPNSWKSIIRHLFNFWGDLTGIVMGKWYFCWWPCYGRQATPQVGLLDTLQLILDAAAISTAVVIAPGHHPDNAMIDVLSKFGLDHSQWNVWVGISTIFIVGKKNKKNRDVF